MNQIDDGYNWARKVANTLDERDKSREQKLSEALRAVYNESSAILDDKRIVADRSAPAFIYLNNALKAAKLLLEPA